MDIRDLFSQNLRRTRYERGYSQEALALEAGVDRSYISALERGVSGASIDMVDKLAAVLGVETDTLLHRTSNTVGKRPQGRLRGLRGLRGALTGSMMPRANKPSHAGIRIRAVRGWPREHNEEGSYLSFTASEKAELGKMAQTIDFGTAGSEIFSQGDDAAFIYLLADGMVRSYRTLRNGDRQILAFRLPGDLFGLAEHGKYVSSEETIVSSRVYRFAIRKLERFLLKNPNIQERFFVKAIHELRSARRQLVIMGRFDISQRLAVFLLDCSAHENYFDQSEHTLTLPMSRYDIADFLGTSAETVTRALARLEGVGALHRITARVLKLNLDQLKTFIDFD